MDVIPWDLEDVRTRNEEEQQNNDSARIETIDDKCTELDHVELIKLTKEAIRNIVESDPLLSGLPADVTIEELKAQIAVAQGQAITLYLNRGELPRLGIVVPPHSTTVLDLKKAIKRHTNLSLKREKIKKKISWKHVWKKYHLCFDDVRLTDDNENIRAYGITNKAELYYIKRHREKNKLIRHA
ncbi:U11/U12 small nuclear ribonucleoprotein 25 kDa protein-like [Ceratina calcarata]|uniref:U11/U12 small nuclear ribonucleoprotein 25 kDa protein-like n=1 Tax=Ceratina calcarata TaxID=156304 RepID=A0AAJ7NBY3_9HYME|nr:U11/U12 small nuclear ribonucleoprotein 25 kDa protein-like [Ceratina calcarata]